MHLDGDVEFATMQLDYIDSDGSLSWAAFQQEWELRRYGDAPQPVQPRRRSSVSQRRAKRETAVYEDELEAPEEADGTPQEAVDLGVGKRRKKPTPNAPSRPARVSAEHNFGDLTRFEPPPKQGATAFVHFSKDFRAKNDGAKKMAATKIADAWNKLTAEERQPYVNVAEEEKQRYNAEVAAYIEKYKDVIPDEKTFRALGQALREKERREKTPGKRGRKAKKVAEDEGAAAPEDEEDDGGAEPMDVEEEERLDDAEIAGAVAVEQQQQQQQQQQNEVNASENNVSSSINNRNDNEGAQALADLGGLGGSQEQQQQQQQQQDGSNQQEQQQEQQQQGI